MVLILLGAPGSGKGTQAKLLIDKLKIPQLSTGDMLRAAIKEGSELGKKASNYMLKGLLVPDSLVLDLLGERIQQADCNMGFILDGFPRNLNQAEALEQLLQSFQKKVDSVIALDVDQKQLVQRLTGRRTCKSCGAGFHVVFKSPQVTGKCDHCHGELFQREDDVESVIKERLQVYETQTAPLLEYYRKKEILEKVEGIGSPTQILQIILDIFHRDKGRVSQ